MMRVLLVGYDPETVDFSALPPGLTAEKIRAGIAVALNRFAEYGMEADVGFIRPDETAGPTVERLLASTTYDCVVIGVYVGLPPRRLEIFEAVINAVRKAAPGAAIAFNTRPEGSADESLRKDGRAENCDPSPIRDMLALYGHTLPPDERSTLNKALAAESMMASPTAYKAETDKVQSQVKDAMAMLKEDWMEDEKNAGSWRF